MKKQTVYPNNPSHVAKFSHAVPVTSVPTPKIPISRLASKKVQVLAPNIQKGRVTLQRGLLTDHAHTEGSSTTEAALNSPITIYLGSTVSRKRAPGNYVAELTVRERLCEACCHVTE